MIIIISGERSYLYRIKKKRKKREREDTRRRPLKHNRFVIVAGSDGRRHTSEEERVFGAKRAFVVNHTHSQTFKCIMYLRIET